MWGSTNRMLKKSASGVLDSRRGSTYGTQYASPLRSLRPCWTDFLSILRECSLLVPDVPVCTGPQADRQALEILLCRKGFFTACEALR
jgi:hypothetical protein